METVSDTIVNGRRKLVVKYTEAEKAEMAKRLEELRKKHQVKNQTRKVVEKHEDNKPKVEKAKKKSTKRAKGKKK